MNIDKEIVIGHAVASAMRGMHVQENIEKPIIYTNIFQYITGVESSDSVRVANALKTDLTLRRLYTNLLKKNTRFHLPQAAAAASQNYIAERDADEFNIRIVAAKVRPQHYIIVSVKHPDLMADGTELVLHVIEGDNNARCHFPPLQDGSTQLVVDNDDILLTLMTSLSAEIFIR